MEDEKKLDPTNEVDEQETREIVNRDNMEPEPSGGEEWGGDVIIIK